MRQEILNKRSELGPYETDNGNSIIKTYNAIGQEEHVSVIPTLESFNECRKNVYLQSECVSDYVIDGDIICHKKWFEYDKFLEKAFDEENEYPMTIDWDYRFYVVVKSYDGRSYAVNIEPRFYRDLSTSDGYDYARQLIIPIEELSDDYVFALTDSYIMKRFSECSSSVVTDTVGIVSTRGSRMFTISKGYLDALRFIAFLDSFKKKHPKLAIHYDGDLNSQNWFKLYLNGVSAPHENFYLTFYPSYIDSDKDVIICRQYLVNKLKKEGYTVIKFSDIINGKYIDDEYSKKESFVRTHECV